jgi:predicted Rossmann fold flavoprotein
MAGGRTREQRLSNFADSKPFKEDAQNQVAIIGAGPAGCMAAYFLQNHFNVTLFDPQEPLRTLLPTGGGRCNLAHAEYDFKALAANYPCGEKFLYSVFSRFATADTIEFFEKIGVRTYTQDDGRIFPTSNDAAEVRKKFLKVLKKCKFVKKHVTKLPDADYIIIAIGGGSSYKLAKPHKIIEPRPALTGLRTAEDFSALAGVAVDDVLFTHQGVSGPAIYKISSLRARENFPYCVTLDLTGEIEIENSDKTVKNVLPMPKSLAAYIAGDLADTKWSSVNNKNEILRKCREFEITVVGTVKDGEVVTSGGVCLDEVDARTMRSKLVPNLYFCGEVLDIDGFCGGFNLQNCWSTGFIAAQGVLKQSP